MQWIAVGVGVALIYWVIPDLLAHHAQVGGWAGDGRRGDVALTFDDGPGPDTGQILAALRQSGIHATFFMVADRAQKCPDIARQVAEEGHEIALHGWHHRSSWLLTPWGTVREILRGRAILEAVTGQTPKFYRPPWGHHNLVTWIVPGLVGMRRVLWSVAPDDWRQDRTSADITRHVARFAMPGAVVVLHDAGGDRSRTVAAVEPIVHTLRALALSAVCVGQMQPETSWLRRVWYWWESFFTQKGQIDTVPASDGGPPVMRLGRAAYKGPRVTGDDGSVVASGTAMAEIHFQNPTLGADSRYATGALRTYVRVSRGLSDVARVVGSSPIYQDVEIVGGVTLLDATQAIERMGFQRAPVHGWHMFWMRVYLTLLMAIFHAQGFRVLSRWPRLKPILIYMPRDQFLARYNKTTDTNDGRSLPR